MRLRPVDPNQSQRFKKRFLEPLAISSAGTWYVKTIAPRVDPFLNRLTGGRISSLPIPIAFLTHTGARSGKQRQSPLVYFTDGDDVVLMASNYGRAKHPAWYYNVQANPEVTLSSRGRDGSYRARVAEPAERDRLWALAKHYTRAYERYESFAPDREIQIVVCSPLDPA